MVDPKKFLVAVVVITATASQVMAQQPANIASICAGMEKNYNACLVRHQQDVAALITRFKASGADDFTIRAIVRSYEQQTGDQCPSIRSVMWKIGCPD